MGFNVTENLIAKTPLPSKPTLPQIVAWIDTVAPCLVAGIPQAVSDAELIIGHLRFKKHLNDETIGAALANSHYKWTLPMSETRISMAMATQTAPRFQNARPEPARMGPRGKPDRSFIKQKAAELGALYSANKHAPDVQERLWRDLEALVYEVGDLGSDDPMPGRGQMASERERIANIQKEILMNAGELGRQMSLQLGPLGLHRARGGFVLTPDRPGTRYRPPNLTRMPRR